MGGMAKGGGMPKGMGMMMGMGGMGAPSPKDQLTALVAKLDQLTNKPLTIHFDDAQNAKVKEQLAGLAEMEELTAEEAKKRLDALLDILKDFRDTLEAAGYRFPGGQGPGRRPPGGQEAGPNPFKDGPNAEHLSGLLGKPAAKSQQ
jgi:hypothetical protein